MKNKIKYITNILNLDTNKMFKSDIDKEYVSDDTKKYFIENIKSFQREFKNNPIKSDKWSTSEAFNYCGMYLTNTPCEAIAKMLIFAMQRDFKVATELLEYINDELIELGLINKDA